MEKCKYNLVTLLPMKAHSERVSGKNFKLLGSRPLFHWILDTLLSIREIDKIVINTDARELLVQNGVSETERIMIRDRKPDLCGDLVSMNKIIYDDIENVPSENYIMTHTTNPFLSARTINSALNQFITANKENAADSLFSVTRHQTRFYRKDGSAINHDPKNLIRTQDLEPWYEENSNLYIFTKDSFLRTDARIGERPYIFETQKLESMDIDEPEDWEIASALAAYVEGNG